MAAPTFVSVSAIAANNSATPSVAVTIPTHTSGDLLLLQMESANQTTATPTSTGLTWTQVSGSPITTTTNGNVNISRLTVYSAVGNGTATSVTAALAAAGDHIMGAVSVYNHGSGTPVIASTATGESLGTAGVQTLPAVTTTTADNLIASVASRGDDTGAQQFNTGTWVNTPTPNYVEQLDGGSTLGDGGGLGLATRTQATVSVTLGSVTTARAVPVAFMTIALAPPSSGSVASSTGSGAATGIGAASSASVGASSGAGVATGIGASTAASVGAASGAGTATGVGAAAAPAVGAASGAGSATAVGASTARSVGASTGTGSAAGIGAATSAAVGASAGAATVSGVGASLSEGVGSAAGISEALGISSGIILSEGVGSAAGAASVSGVGESRGGPTPPVFDPDEGAGGLNVYDPSAIKGYLKRVRASQLAQQERDDERLSDKEELHRLISEAYLGTEDEPTIEIVAQSTMRLAKQEHVKVDMTEIYAIIEDYNRAMAQRQMDDLMTILLLST